MKPLKVGKLEIKSSMPNALSALRVYALKAFYEYYNEPLRGKVRAQKRTVERWLDKIGAEWVDIEMSENFLLKCKKYPTVLEVIVEVNYKKKQLEYEFRLLFSDDLVEREEL